MTLKKAFAASRRSQCAETESPPVSGPASGPQPARQKLNAAPAQPSWQACFLSKPRLVQHLNDRQWSDAGDRRLILSAARRKNRRSRRSQPSCIRIALVSQPIQIALSRRCQPSLLPRRQIGCVFSPADCVHAAVLQPDGSPVDGEAACADRGRIGLLTTSSSKLFRRLLTVFAD